MRVLAADIGATHARFAMAEAGSDGARLAFERTYATAKLPGFDPALQAFLDEFHGARGAARAPLRAAIAVAGPVQHGVAQLTNRPAWRVAQFTIESRLGIPVRLLNDFAALAIGVAGAAPQDWIALQAGDPQPQGTIALVGAGSGLGVAALVREGDRLRPLATEAGHVSFAPQDEAQAALWRHLRARHGRVSAERVLSGTGLLAVYGFVRGRDGQGEALQDPAEVPRRALAEAGGPAARALDLFVACYGAFAGDIALAFLARGGLYLGGGIAAKLAPRLAQGDFMAAFNAKGRHAGLAASIPVRLLRNEKLGLLGAAAWAARD